MLRKYDPDGYRGLQVLDDSSIVAYGKAMGYLLRTMSDLACAIMVVDPSSSEAKRAYEDVVVTAPESIQTTMLSVFYRAMVVGRQRHEFPPTDGQAMRAALRSYQGTLSRSDSARLEPVIEGGLRALDPVDGCWASRLLWDQMPLTMPRHEAATILRWLSIPDLDPIG
ncbi:MAG: hypothetical protein U0163_05325 [Gemmatimonadaceae bacterium]